MTETEAKVVHALQALGHALTGKECAVSEFHLGQLIEGHEYYLPDGGYSRIIVSELTDRARLTDNSRPEVKAAWHLREGPIADLERHVLDARREMGAG